MVFRSKVDAWLVLVAVGVPATALGLVAYRARLDPKAIPIVIVMALALIIRSGVFRWRVPIRQIESVTPTNNPSSAPALSLDRLEIRYGPKTILVSPADQEGFVRALRTVNPRIDLPR